MEVINTSKFWHMDEKNTAGTLLIELNKRLFKLYNLF